MTVARQVQAKRLQAKLKPTEGILQVRATRASLFGGASANDDVISYLPSSFYSRSNVSSHDATSLRISGNAIAEVSAMLGLTDRQKDGLARAVTSVTASGYRAAEGSDALVVFAGESHATRALHELGFARVRELGKILPDRFYKVVKSANGTASTAWAHFEGSAGGDFVYAHITLIAAV